MSDAQWFLSHVSPNKSYGGGSKKDKVNHTIDLMKYS